MSEMTVETALATIEHPTGMADKTWLLCVYAPAAEALAREVRRLQGMTCETCCYQNPHDVSECFRKGMEGADVSTIEGCRAWAPKP